MPVKRCPGCGVMPYDFHAGMLCACPVEKAAYEARIVLLHMEIRQDLNSAIIWDPDKQGEFASECVERQGVK